MYLSVVISRRHDHFKTSILQEPCSFKGCKSCRLVRELTSNWGANLWTMNLQVAQEFAERLKKVLEEANLLQGLGSCNREDQHPVLAKVDRLFRLSIRLL